MKRVLSIIVLICLLALLVFIRNYNSPHYRIKKMWGIDISCLDYEVLDITDKWCLNGDGCFYIDISYNKSTKPQLCAFNSQLLKLNVKSLPSEESFIGAPSSFDEYNNEGCNGYYIIRVDGWSIHQYLVVDTDKKRILSWVNIM